MTTSLNFKINLKKSLAALLCIGALPFCAQAQGEKKQLTVCQVFDRSSAFGESARDYSSGAKSYFDSVNARGGFNGKKVQFLTFDIQEEQTRESVKTLIDQEGCEVFFGVVGDDRVRAVATHPQVLAQRLPVFAPLSGIDRIEENANVLFTRATYAQEVVAALEQLSRMGIKRVATVYTAAFQARGIRETVDANKAKFGMTIYNANFDGKDASLASLTSTLHSNKPQAVFVVGDSIDVGRVVRAYRPVDRAAFYVGLSLVNRATVMALLGTDQHSGLILTQVTVNPMMGSSQLARDHLKAMRLYFEESATYTTLEGYAAAKALLLALRNNGGKSDAVSLARAVSNQSIDLGDYALQFIDGRGSRYVDIVMVRKDGTFTQ